MKRALQLIIAMSFVAMFLVSPVAAATSQGLEWSVAVDDEFTFQYTFVEEGVTLFSEGVNFTVASAPGTIPDPLTNLTYYPFVDVDFAFTNGTAIPLEYTIMLIGIVFAGGSLAVPTGNFTLLTTWLQSTLLFNENTTMVNDGTKWGINLFVEDSEDRIDVDVHYLKADGFISYYDINLTNKTSGLSSSATLTRDGAGLDIIGLLTDNILYVGIGVGVLLILAVVCMRRK